MYPWNREYALRGAIFVAICMSGLMLAEYAGTAPALCNPGGGCDFVESSAYAYPGGVPLPLLGLVFFGTMLAIALHPRARRWLVPVSIAGAIGGLGFIAVQAFVLQAFCWMCLTVDLTAIFIGLLAVSLRRHVPPAADLRAALGYSAAVVVLVVGSFGAQRYVSGKYDRGVSRGLPTELQPYQSATKATVIEFVDFGCPHCRELHEVFTPMLATHADEVHAEYIVLPLASSREPAAKAYMCAEQLGGGPAMAAALFDSRDLSEQHTRKLAQEIGLDGEAFSACVGSEQTAEQLQKNKDLATAIRIRGLPTVWIGNERFEGAHPEAALRASLARALRDH